MDNHEHSSNVNHPGSFLAGMLMGGLAGAGAMLLLAPKSGKRTRAQIQSKSTELRTLATEAMDEAMTRTRGKARRLTAELREKTKEIQQRGQDVLAEQTARLSATVAAGQTALQVALD